MAINTINKVGYGLSEPLPEISNQPIRANRNPLTTDKAPIGQMWINRNTNAFFILTSIVNNVATWVTGNSGSGVFATVTATGNIETTGGNIISAGNVDATGDIAGATLYAVADSGPVVGATGMTNDVDTTQGAGILSILSTNANAGNNTGFLKFYVGATTVYVPYFDDIAP